ncbi:MAG: hypothetical protein ACM3H7_02435 [Acidobacteriaceae bacterium]
MKTKLRILLGLTFTLSLVLGACAKGQAAGTGSTESNAQESNSLSRVNLLLVGTLKLEDSEQKVTAEQATSLLPLWQAYRSLSTNQTAAEAEVEALLNQIESTMTTEQMGAIEAMSLTSNDMVNLMQSLGAGMRPGGTPDPESTPGFDFPGGGMVFQGSPPDLSAGSPPSDSNSGSGTRRNFPSGGAISGGPRIENFSMGDAGSAAGLGDGPVMQGTPDPSMQATAQARFSTQANQVNAILLNVLISNLEAMATD